MRICVDNPMLLFCILPLNPLHLIVYITRSNISAFPTDSADHITLTFLVVSIMSFKPIWVSIIFLLQYIFTLELKL